MKILPLAWNALLASNTSTSHYWIIVKTDCSDCFSHQQRPFPWVQNHQTPLVRCMFLLSTLGRPFARTGNCRMAAQCYLPMSFVGPDIHLLLWSQIWRTIRTHQTFRWENSFGKIWDQLLRVSAVWWFQDWLGTGTDCSGTSLHCSTVVVMSTSGAIDRFYKSLCTVLQEVYLAAHLSKVWPVSPLQVVWPKILGARRLRYNKMAQNFRAAGAPRYYLACCRALGKMAGYHKQKRLHKSVDDTAPAFQGWFRRCYARGPMGRPLSYDDRTMGAPGDLWKLNGRCNDNNGGI